MAAKDTKKMEIHTCYTVKIKHQLDAVPDRKTKKLNISRKRRVDDRSMQQTAEICLEALRFCVDVALKVSYLSIWIPKGRSGARSSVKGFTYGERMTCKKE